MSGDGSRGDGALAQLRLRSEADRIDQAVAGVDAVLNLVDKAIRAVGDGDRPRAEALLDRAAGLMPTDDLPEGAKEIVRQTRASIARIRTAVQELDEPT